MKIRQPNSHFFNPLRWTALTWIAVFAWSWGSLPQNYPPSVSYEVDAATGDLTNPTRYSSLSEYPFPVGWPFHYVEPDDPTRAMTPVLAGTPIPPPGPSSISVLAMVANGILILASIAALIVLSQAFFPRFSLRLFLMLPLLYPAYLGVARVIGMLGGYTAVEWFSNGIYFSPILLYLSIAFFHMPVSFQITNQKRSAEIAG
jgi:hypothetical protein